MGKSRILMLIGLTLDQDTRTYSNDDIINHLRRIRQIAEEKSRLSLSMAVPEDVDVIKIRKISECCLAGSQVRLNLCLGKKNKISSRTGPKNGKHTSMKDRGIQEKQVTDEEGDSWEKVKSRKKLPRTRQDSLIVVSKENKTYSEILKAVKEGEKPAQLPGTAKLLQYSAQGTKTY
uniref:Uncharacterized protein n=1 Tax=Graphocephala atropunctata TaxID=36148 RepID=A0A1B6KNK0_9HEMI